MSSSSSSSSSPSISPALFSFDIFSPPSLSRLSEFFENIYELSKTHVNNNSDESDNENHMDDVLSSSSSPSLLSLSQSLRIPLTQECSTQMKKNYHGHFPSPKGIRMSSSSMISNVHIAAAHSPPPPNPLTTSVHSSPSGRDTQHIYNLIMKNLDNICSDGSLPKDPPSVPLTHSDFINFIVMPRRETIDLVLSAMSIMGVKTLDENKIVLTSIWIEEALTESLRGVIKKEKLRLLKLENNENHNDRDHPHSSNSNPRKSKSKHRKNHKISPIHNQNQNDENENENNPKRKRPKVERERDNHKVHQNENDEDDDSHRNDDSHHNPNAEADDGEDGEE